MRRHLLLLLVIVSLAGCGDGGSETTAASDATPGTESTAGSDTTAGSDPTTGPGTSPCAELDVAVLDQVEDPGPDDQRSEDAGPPPEELQEIEEAADALQRVAEGGPEELRADAAAAASFLETVHDDPEGASAEAESSFHEARQRLLDWGVEHCEVDGPVWGCARRVTFRLVGEPIDGPTRGPDPETPESVLASVDIDPAWEMVEVERTDERVTFAWLDAAGVAVYSATAEAARNGWREDQTTTCDVGEGLGPGDDEEDMVPVPEELPPPLSSSVPSE